MARNVHTLKLKELIQPYNVLRLDYIGAELRMPAAEVEKLCALLILDGKLHGWIDQVRIAPTILPVYAAGKAMAASPGWWMLPPA
jgi:hypothetical protein